MAQNNPYDPDVYKRLDLVRKQFQHQEAEKKKQSSADRRWEILNRIEKNRVRIARTAVYIILAALVFSVILTLVLK